MARVHPPFFVMIDLKKLLIIVMPWGLLEIVIDMLIMIVSPDINCEMPGNIFVELIFQHQRPNLDLNAAVAHTHTYTYIYIYYIHRISNTACICDFD